MVTLTTSDKDQAKLINNRQNGRRRGRGGQQPRNGQPNNVDRGNRIDNRARGNAAQLLEKYRNLARDAQMQGDRVNTEYYLQFADHYFRVLSENRARFEEQRPAQGQGDPQRARRDDYRDDFGQDGDDESDGEGQRYDQTEQRWNESEDDRPQRQERPERQDRQERAPRYEDASAEADGEQGQPQQAQPRFEGERRPRRERNPRNGNAGYNGNGHAVHADAAEPVSERIEIDRLPQSLSPTAEPVEASEDEAPRPRRRAPRRPRTETAPAEV